MDIRIGFPIQKILKISVDHYHLEKKVGFVPPLVWRCAAFKDRFQSRLSKSTRSWKPRFLGTYESHLPVSKQVCNACGYILVACPKHIRKGNNLNESCRGGTKLWFFLVHIYFPYFLHAESDSGVRFWQNQFFSLLPDMIGLLTNYGYHTRLVW